MGAAVTDRVAGRDVGIVRLRARGDGVGDTLAIVEEALAARTPVRAAYGRRLATRGILRAFYVYDAFKHGKDVALFGAFAWP